MIFGMYTTNLFPSCLNKGTIHPHEEQASAFGLYPILTQHFIKNL